MTTMTNLMKTTTRTKPSPRSAYPSCTSSSSCHVRGLINHIVLFPLLQLTVSFTFCLRRALKNTGFNRMSCFHPHLSELRTSHIITGVLCLLGMIVFSWRTLLKFRGVTLFPVAAFLLDVIRSDLRDPLKPSLPKKTTLAYSRTASCWKMLCDLCVK